jgi:hypothetical protein
MSMKKLITVLFVLTFISGAFSTTITETTIKKWITECHEEFLKKMEGIEAGSPQSEDKRKSIEQDYLEWYEGYKALQKGEQVSMWTFRTQAAKSRLTGISACPETASKLPDLSP